ncbi:AraC family transcriptional regulator [Chryseobacterium indologenes]|nr:AraC family transcriptional regulator [Chryseobacterium indologenes]
MGCMRNGFVFKSKDMEIMMKEVSAVENTTKPFTTESQSGFNLFFLLHSNMNLKVHEDSRVFLLKKNQYILYHESEENTTLMWPEAKETLKYFHLRLSYHHITNLINPASNREGAEILDKMIHNKFIFLHKGTPPDMTVEMHMIINEMVHYSKEGIVQKLFMEAKVIKLLILIFEQFSEKKAMTSSFKTPEIVKRFIDENYHRNIKAEEIAELVGISQNRIRKEFKTQYHTTMVHYISELRMLKARKLITDKEIMIKEIAIECGYEYLQNFTRAFKKKFGVSPEKLRNNT